MSEVNRSINIYLNESEVEASLGRLNKSAVKLEEQMKDIADKSSPKFAELADELGKVNSKMNTLSKQLSGEAGPSMKQLEQNISKLRNELKQTSTGTEDFNKKVKQLALAEKDLKKLNLEISGIKDSMNKASGASGIFGALKDKVLQFAGSIPGIGTAITAAMGPLGLIVGALGLLIGLVTQNAEVADKLSFIMAGLGKVVRFLADSTVDFLKNGIGKLKEAFANPKQALIDFGKAIVENIINRFQSLGVIMEAITTGNIKMFSDGVLQLATGITNVTDKAVEFGNKAADAFNKGYDAAAKLDELIVQQAQMRKNIEQTNNVISEQTTLMKNAVLSDEERLAAAKKIIALETLNANRRISLIQLELNAIKEKNDGMVLSGEEQAKMLDLETAKLQAITAKNDAIRKASNQAAALEAELAAKRIKESMLVDTVPAITQAVLETNAEVANLTKVNTNTAITGIETFASYAEMRIKGMLDNLKGYWSEWGQVFQAGVQSMNTLVSDGLDLQRAKSDKELAQDKKANDAKVKMLKMQLDTKRISQTQYDKAVEKIQEQQAAKERAAKVKQFKMDKAAKIAMSVINTAMAVVNALATMPYPASIAMAAIAGATGAAQIGIIAAQPVPEFAKGGYLNGPSHQAGGMAVVGYGGQKVAEVEGGEFIVNRQSTRKHFNLLNALNAEGNGGKYARFNAGGVLSAVKYAAGGLFTPQGDSGSMQQQILLLQNIYDSLQQPVPAVVDYGEVKRRGDDLNRAKGRASFSQ